MFKKIASVSVNRKRIIKQYRWKIQFNIIGL